MERRCTRQQFVARGGAAKILLSSDADINAQNSRVGTPLIALMTQKWESFCYPGNVHIPREKCHKCCAKVLLEWGAELDAECGRFGTALQAAEKVKNKEGIMMLLGDEASESSFPSSGH
jgi:hypothetical protein